MDGARSKLIVKRQGAKVVEPTQLELQIGRALFELQNSSSDISVDLRSLQIYGAREIDLEAGRRALLIIVPVPQLKLWRRIQVKVVRELEKKLGSGDARSIVVVAHRRIIGKPDRKVARQAKNGRPRSRTLTSVHENWLEDLVYPTEIVGKRTRVKVGGHRTVKVLLDPKDQTILETKLETLAGVYNKLTGKDVVFEFPAFAAVDEEARRK
jgi:small subunit ribosomal protein S7e